jgi:hypothetical protein
MSSQPNQVPFDAFAISSPAKDVDDITAVILMHGQMRVLLSISQARDISNRLARAADDAELKLPQ